jgi:hypothetical protein
VQLPVAHPRRNSRLGEELRFVGGIGTHDRRPGLWPLRTDQSDDRGLKAHRAENAFQLRVFQAMLGLHVLDERAYVAARQVVGFRVGRVRTNAERGDDERESEVAHDAQRGELHRLTLKDIYDDG